MTLPSVVCGTQPRGRSRSRSRSRGRSWSRPRSWSRGRSRGERLFDLPQSDEDHGDAADRKEEWLGAHVGEIKTAPSMKKSSETETTVSSPSPKKKRPPAIDTKSADTKVTVVTSDAPASNQHPSKSNGGSTEPPKTTHSTGDDSVDHLVAYYVDQIPSLTNLCWHRLETTDSSDSVVYVPARICAVKKVSQQAMIDDLGFLKGGRFRVVPTSELIRFNGSSQKRKWCPELMKAYLDYISQHHNANDVKEEERFLKKVLKAVKEKDHTTSTSNQTQAPPKADGRDDEEEGSHDSVYIHQNKHGTLIDVHATDQGTSLYMKMRDEPPAEREGDSIGAFPASSRDTKPAVTSGNDSYYAKKLQDTKDKHAKKHEARVKFDMSDEAATVTKIERPTPIKAVAKQMESMDISSPPADNSGLDAETWWIVLRGTKLSRGATPLVNRCMRTYGWTEAYATRVLEGYKQFCAWKQAFEDWDDGALAPPLPIRQMWQQHLLDSRNYQADCMILFGHVLQYNPDNGADTMMERERIENTKRIAHVRFRGRDYDKEVWTWKDDNTDFSGRETNIQSPESKRELRPITIPHSRSSASEDAVPQSMREALALVQQARKDLKAPRPSRPYSLQIMPNASSSSDVSSVSSNNVIRLRIIGNGKNGLRSASITMDYSGEFTQVFQDYAGEYAQRIGQPRVMLRFLTKDGRRITNADTPKKLRLLNNDEIIVVQPESDKSSWI